MSNNQTAMQGQIYGRAQQAHAKGPHILGASTNLKFSLYFPNYLLYAVINV